MDAHELENRIGAIWCRVLGVADVDGHDDFFDQGGSSFEAVELVAAIREEFDFSFGYRTLFENSTFGDVVRAVVSGAGTGAARARAVDTPLGSRAHGDLVLPIHPNQDGLLSWQRWLAEHEQPVDPFNLSRIYRIRGDLDVDALERALVALAARHDALRASFPANGEAGVQVIHADTRPTLAVSDIKERDIAAHVAKLREPSADIQSGMLLRSALFRVHPRDFVLVIVVPHLVADGWAMTNLTRELEVLYGAFVLGQPSPLESLPLTYVDYVRQELAWLGSDEASDATWYWRAVLGEGGVYPSVKLGFQKDVRVDELSLDVGHYDSTIPRELVDRLTGLGAARSRAAGFLAGVMSALVQNTIDSRPGIQTAFSHRGVLAHQSLVAWLNNSATIRFAVSPDDSFVRVLSASQDAVIRALEAGRLPFMEMVRRIEPARFREPPTNDFISVIYDDDFLSGPRRELMLRGTVVERIPPPATGHQQSISIRLHPSANGDVGMMLIYDPRQFDAGNIVAFGDSIRDGIGRALQRPDRPIRKSFAVIAT